MENTKDQIVGIMRASALPISIIIVCLGTMDFSSMDILNANMKLLYSKKFEKEMERDIVQFIPFLKYKYRVKELAYETLDEVPG